ncbi:MAG: hypothetical protein ABIR52_11050 [Casimicrobiaceae bacterium]
MNDLLLWLGRLTGVIGLAVCVGAVALRLTGAYWLGGFQVGTLLIAGTASLAAGAFFLLLVSTRRGARDR